MILEGARNDFRCGGGGRIDEHDDRNGLRLRRERGESLHGIAGTVVGFNGLEDVVGLRRAALRRNDVGVCREEGRADADGGLKKSARVVAQVEHKALEVSGLLELIEVLGKILRSAFLELRNADVADAVGKLLHAHGLRFDHCALERELQGLHFALACYLKANLGLGFAAHELDGVIERKIRRRFAVDFGNDVARANARTGRRGVVDGRDHAHAGRILRHLNAEAAECAVRSFIHVLEPLGVEEVRMRIETAHHAFDRKFKELLIAYFVDVVVLDGIEDARKLADFLQRQSFGRAFLCIGLKADAGENAGTGAGNEKGKKTKFHA